MIVIGRSRESGQGLVEYALLLVMVAVVVVAVLFVLGARVSGMISDVVAATGDPGGSVAQPAAANEIGRAHV